MKFIVLFFLFLNISCQSFDQAEDKPAPEADYGLTPPELAQAYEKGIKYLDDEDYQRAADQFNSLVSKYPASPLNMAMLFNAGAAYEGLRDCRKAGKNFRKIVRGANGESPKIQALALVRLSYAYECLNADKKVITSLIDAKERETYLEKPTKLAELPARMGSAYGRIGKHKLADKLFKQAEKGLYELRDRTQSPQKQRDELARAMFFMGRYWYKGFHIKNHKNIFKTYEKTQSYLVRSVELDSPKWSPISAKNLVEVYQYTFKYLNSAFKNNKVGKYNVSREEINSLAVHALQGLRTLKKMRFPDKRPPQIVNSLFYKLDGLEKDYSDFLTKNNLGFSLSKDEKFRQSLKREGRTLNPNPKLEKMMKDVKKNNIKISPAQ